MREWTPYNWYKRGNFKLFLIYLLHLFFKGKFNTKAMIWKIASRSSDMKFCAFQDWGAYDIVYAWWKSSDRHLEGPAHKSVTWFALHWTGKFHLWMWRLDATAKRKSCCKLLCQTAMAHQSGEIRPVYFQCLKISTHWTTGAAGVESWESWSCCSTFAISDFICWIASLHILSFSFNSLISFPIFCRAPPIEAVVLFSISSPAN